jgi:hypothetical protein
MQTVEFYPNTESEAMSAMRWLLWPVIPTKQRPAVRYQYERATSRDKRMASCEMAWHLWASTGRKALWAGLRKKSKSSDWGRK